VSELADCLKRFNMRLGDAEIRYCIARAGGMKGSNASPLAGIEASRMNVSNVTPPPGIEAGRMTVSYVPPPPGIEAGMMKDSSVTPPPGLEMLTKKGSYWQPQPPKIITLPDPYIIVWTAFVCKFGR